MWVSRSFCYFVMCVCGNAGCGFTIRSFSSSSRSSNLVLLDAPPVTGGAGGGAAGDPSLESAAPREDEEYSLISSDGRYLWRMATVPPCRQSRQPSVAVHTLDFVRVPGSHELVYLRFGETISPRSTRWTSSPKFRLFTRVHPTSRLRSTSSDDGKSRSGVDACATPSGSVEQAAFRPAIPPYGGS